MSSHDALRNYFEDERETELAKRLFQRFHDKMLLEESVSHDNAFLLSVYMACNAEGQSKVASRKAQEIFVLMGRPEDQYRVYLSRAEKQGNILKIDLKEKEGAELSPTAKGLKAVKQLLGGEFGIKTFIIKAGQQYRGRRLLEEMVFSELKNDVRICDPYVDVGTLDLLTATPKPSKVRILTSNIPSEQQFARELRNFMKQYTDIQITVAVHRKRSLHDRYLTFEKGAVSFGGSLKDVGKNDTIVSWLPEEVSDALNEIFDLRWNEAQILSV